MELERARQIGKQVVDALASTCQRIQIAGSVRRCKLECNDIEIVYIPKMEARQVDLFGATKEIPLVDLAIARCIDEGLLARDMETRRWGPKYKRAIHVPSGVVIELFSADQDNWGCVLAIRTGPVDFNKIVAAKPWHGGIMPTDLRMVECSLWRNGQQLATPTEESFFAALRIPCWPPSERSAAMIAEYLESCAPTLGTILISLRKEQ